MNYSSVIAKIPQPNGKEKVVKDYQSTKDIIKDLVFCFKNYNYQAKPIVELARTGNVKTDGKVIYDFIKNNIEYKAEPEGDQTTRSFSRIIHDKWGDCKHSALIVGSLAWNEGYTVIFRFVSYHDGETYGHVYTIIEDPKTGERVIVDPLQKFNYEKNFIKKVDYKAKNDMTLSRLTGIEQGRNAASVVKKQMHLQHKRKPHNHVKRSHACPAHLSPHTSSNLVSGMFMNGTEGDYFHGMDNEMRIVSGGTELFMTPNFESSMHGEIESITGIGRRTKAQRKAARSARRTKRKERGGAFRMIALAPVRGAFSALVLLNFKGFATRFKKLIDSGKEKEVQAFSKKFGYKYNIFKGQVLRGAKKKNLGEISGDEMHNVDGMGFVVTATAIATASAAIAAALALFKRLGIKAPGDDTAAGQAMEALSTGKGQTDISTSDGGGGSGGGTSSRDSGGGSGGGSSEGGSSDSGGGASASDGGGGSDEEEKAKGFLGLPTPVIVIGGIGLAVVAGKIFKIF